MALLRLLLAYLRFIIALLLVLIGGVLIQQSFWFHGHVESWVRIPLVVAAVGVGIFSAFAGLRMLRAGR
jgi:ABC-type molybdate transport system permease subunit